MMNLWKLIGRVKPKRKRKHAESDNPMPFVLLDKMAADLDPAFTDAAHVALRKIWWKWQGVDIDDE